MGQLIIVNCIKLTFIIHETKNGSGDNSNKHSAVIPTLFTCLLRHLLLTATQEIASLAVWLRETKKLQVFSYSSLFRREED